MSCSFFLIASFSPHNTWQLSTTSIALCTVLCTYPLTRVYYRLAVWRFKPILSASLRFHSHLPSGLRLRNYRAVAGNHKFSSWFSVFACFCGGYSNRVNRLRRLSGNFTLLKASLFYKGLPFRACEQLIRCQNLFVCCLVNGDTETICSVLKILWSL